MCVSGDATKPLVDRSLRCPQFLELVLGRLDAESLQSPFAWRCFCLVLKPILFASSRDVECRSENMTLVNVNPAVKWASCYQRFVFVPAFLRKVGMQPYHRGVRCVFLYVFFFVGHLCFAFLIGKPSGEIRKPSHFGGWWARKKRKNQQQETNQPLVTACRVSFLVP